jgi:hypothetical protein
MIRPSVHTFTPQETRQGIAAVSATRIDDPRALLSSPLIYLHDPVIDVVHLRQVVVLGEILHLKTASLQPAVAWRRVGAMNCNGTYLVEQVFPVKRVQSAKEIALVEPEIANDVALHTLVASELRHRKRRVSRYDVLFSSCSRQSHDGDIRVILPEVS